MNPGINPRQLIDYVIEPTLNYMGAKYNSVAAIPLLLATAAVESSCGYYLKQISGPARGIYQMEPATFIDVKNNADPHKFLSLYSVEELIWDLRAATIAARLLYFRFPDPMPAFNTLDGMWEFYKRRFNTELGATTVSKFTDAWNKYVIHN